MNTDRIHRKLTLNFSGISVVMFLSAIVVMSIPGAVKADPLGNIPILNNLLGPANNNSHSGQAPMQTPAAQSFQLASPVSAIVNAVPSVVPGLSIAGANASPLSNVGSLGNLSAPVNNIGASLGNIATPISNIGANLPQSIGNITGGVHNIQNGLGNTNARAGNFAGNFSGLRGNFDNARVIPSVINGVQQTANQVPIFSAPSASAVRGLSMVESKPLTKAANFDTNSLIHPEQDTVYQHRNNGRVQLDRGTMLVSPRSHKHTGVIQTPIGELKVSKKSDVLVKFNDGILRVQNLDNIGDDVQVKLSGKHSETEAIAIGPGYELVASRDALTKEALYPSDGIGRRNPILIGDGKTAVIEINLASAIKTQPAIKSLRNGSREEQKQFQGMLKTAAILEMTRGKGGFVSNLPILQTIRSAPGAAKSLVNVREIAGDVLGVVGELLPGNGNPGGPGGPPEPPLPPVPPPVPPTPPAVPPVVSPPNPPGTVPGTPGQSGSNTALSAAAEPSSALLAQSAGNTTRSVNVETNATRFSQTILRPPGDTTPLQISYSSRPQTEKEKEKKQKDLMSSKKPTPNQLVLNGPLFKNGYERQLTPEDWLNNPNWKSAGLLPKGSNGTGSSAGRYAVTGAAGRQNPFDFNNFDFGRLNLVWPDSVFSLLRESVRRFPEFFIAAAVIFATLLVVSVLLARAALQRARQLDSMNTQLSEEVRERRILETQASHLNDTLEKRLDELNHLNHELELARDQAIEGSRLKSEFVANISHEIRTPLSAVMGMNSLLLNTTELDETQTDYAQTANDAAQSLLTIINDILDFSKIEAGKLMIESVKFSYAESIKEIIDMLTPIATKKGISISSEIDSALHTEMLGDPSRLKQVLLNLASNAVKFTAAGGVVISAVPVEKSGKEYTRFTVKDTGIGIAPEAQEKLFRPFVQADGSTTRRYGGTGLGLSISKRLVELMGGEIKLESKEGKGSTFWFDLPVSKAETAGDHVSKTRDSVLAPMPFSVGPVLVAEDSPVMQRLINQLLKKLGCTVELVTNGLEAVEAASKKNYSMIFMDWQMPELDGLEATRRIRAAEFGTGKHVPIIALTANAMEGDKHTCIAAGMDSYLSKPFKIEDLKDTIQQFAAPSTASSNT